LRARFAGKPEMVVAYFQSLAEEVRNRLSELGVSSLSDLTGRYDHLRAREKTDPSRIMPFFGQQCIAPRFSSMKQLQIQSGLFHSDHSAIEQAASQRIQNSDRAVGTAISGEIARQRSHGQMFGDEVSQDFHGYAGQSFGAFLTHGVTLKLSGEANDYVGKGLSGGTIAITSGPGASRRGDVLAGNTVLYGATSGHLYIAGRAGERFAVRNSGAFAVVEGVGQHGCEYMTGGVALVLGPVGFNFGSGMTGGLAYVLRGEAESSIHRDFVGLEAISSLEEAYIRQMLKEHVHLTGSPRAANLIVRHSPLPLLRVQPILFQGTIEATWNPLLDGHKHGPLGVIPVNHEKFSVEQVQA
jgi:glutamate synthase domain-containing protein 3